VAIPLGYSRLGNEAVAFWESDHGDARIDVNPRTGRRFVLGWRSDYAKRRGRPAVMVDADDAEDMEDLADELGLKPVSKEDWIAFQRAGRWPVGLPTVAAG
jgi:hypothetical protein